MNMMLSWLSGGDLRSDGFATEVANLVLDNENLFEDLLEGLHHPDALIRARTADALEKIARNKPGLLIPHLEELVCTARQDNPMMVKMHLAMIMGHLVAGDVDRTILYTTLSYLLEDKSVFTRSWAIVSLCILARSDPPLNQVILKQVAPLTRDTSIAIRTKAGKAMILLLDAGSPFPRGWIKSDHLQNL